MHKLIQKADHAFQFKTKALGSAAFPARERIKDWISNEIFKTPHSINRWLD